jgi:hypothetical protein
MVQQHNASVCARGTSFGNKKSSQGHGEIYLDQQAPACRFRNRKNEPFPRLPLLTGMKALKSYCLWFVLTGAAAVVSAEPLRTDINPALTYYQAFNAAPDYSQKDRDYLLTNEWRDQKLPDRFGELVAGYDNEFRLIRQAAQSTAPCDWGIDWSAGPGTLLVHLSRIKMAANLARLRVMWDLQNDRQTNACEDLIGALALGRNGATDGSLISALVQFAAERIVCSTVAENFNHFTPEALSQIAAKLNGPPARGSVAACVAIEKTGFKDWLINRALALQAENPGNDAKVMEGLRQSFVVGFSGTDGPKATNNIWQPFIEAAGGTSDGVIKLLRDMDPLYEKWANIENLPRAQYEEQMKGFSVEIKNSANPFVHELFPALEKCRPREFGALADLAMVQAAVQYKLQGEAGLRSVPNPLGQGPFGFQRYIFDGVDRGFELSADYDGNGYPEVFIFVETDGVPFVVFGKNAGKAPTP